jgi:hypothetical protein
MQKRFSSGISENFTLMLPLEIKCGQGLDLGSTGKVLITGAKKPGQCVP